MSKPRGRGRGSGRGPDFKRAGLRPVTEDSRIFITDQLKAFQQGPDQDLTFPPDLNNDDRAIVHDECKKYGFMSKSYGAGARRAVRVTKLQATDRPKRHLKALKFDLIFNEESRAALDAHLKRFPAQAAELDPLSSTAPSMQPSLQYNGGTSNAGADAQGAGGKGKRRGAATAASMDLAEVGRRRARWERQTQQPHVQAVRASTAILPITAHRQQIMETIEQNQVTLIAGETGCGKTTQVPQYMLEASWGQGAGARIMCTQPRRISAISIAQRVAAERGEAVGDNVGHLVRLDAKCNPSTSLVFCTNGVLLRQLTTGQGMEEVTHIVVDEIHERDRFADFLLITLRDLLPAHPKLRLILMSATLHTALFQAYFGGCPIVSVPGFTHPVQDVYLEEVLRLTNHQAEGAALMSRPTEAGRGRSGGGPGRGRAPGRGLPGRGTKHAQREGPAAPPLPPAVTAEVEEVILQSFLQPSDEVFERLLEVTGAASLDDMAAVNPAINIAYPGTGATPLMAAAGHGRLTEVMALLANGADPSLKSTNGAVAAEWAQRAGYQEVADILQEHTEAEQAASKVAAEAAALSDYQSLTDADEVDLDLIASLLRFLCSYESDLSQLNGLGNADEGAILVFLPGWDEIMRLRELLESHPPFNLPGRCQILSLHSMVPPAEQLRVFVRPPKGVRKIVLSTNIAETAVTIDDITCVINSGRVKEKSYDPYTNVSTLQTTWISQASGRQRRGRAGRCQPGCCFHLYSRQRSDNLAPFQLPELQRCPLDELCLQAKLLEIGRAGPGLRVAAFLGRAVEPPMDVAVKNAVQLLEDIGALEPDSEELTVLGRHLAALPLPPRIGKLLLYGILFNCLDPVLTVACCMAYRDPWVLPVEAGARAAAQAAKARLHADAGGGSDHLALVEAFRRWGEARACGQERRLTAQFFLSGATLNMIDGMRTQLAGELQARGLISSVQAASGQAEDTDLVRGVLACGFYPLLGCLEAGPHMSSNPHKTRLVTAAGEEARIHMSSVNSGMKAARPAKGGPRMAPLLIFDELTRGESYLYVRQCTAVNAGALLLVASSLDHSRALRLAITSLSSQDELARSETSSEADVASIDWEDSDSISSDVSSSSGDSDLLGSVDWEVHIAEQAALSKSSKRVQSTSLQLQGFRLRDEEGDDLAQPSRKDTAKKRGKQGGSKGAIPLVASGQSRTGLLTVDGWLQFDMPCDVAGAMAVIRARLNAAFSAKVQQPHQPLPASLTDALQAAGAVLAASGKTSSNNQRPPQPQLNGPQGSSALSGRWQPPAGINGRPSFGNEHASGGSSAPQRGRGFRGRGRGPASFQRNEDFGDAVLESIMRDGEAANGSMNGRGGGRGRGRRGRGRYPSGASAAFTRHGAV
ncbi:hypothetical protein WJX74_009802 [Apatococcus lobatus]|uniref:RNA helicase n=1 Tax=Apatococcus lobatus TaxID=904363 RepID=A0AAW1SFG5_9CHLO